MMQSRANLNIATAFQMGVAFRLGVEYALRPEIASLIKTKLVQARLITNDAEFKENQHPRDKDGKFKSGGGDVNKSIDRERDKYASIASPEYVAYIDNKYPAPVITEKLKATQTRYQERLNSSIAEQTPKAQTLIRQIKINPNGVTVFPALPHSVAKQLGLKNSKKIIMSLEVQKRIYFRHPDVSPENLRCGLGLSLYGAGSRTYDNKQRETYLHFTYKVTHSTINDTVLEIKEKADAYELVHFMKISRRK